MAYPSQFHRLVIIGRAYGDTINTTLSMIPTIATPVLEPNQALVDAVYNFVSTWWADGTGTGIRICQSHYFLGIKLNRINPDGKYADPVTHEKYHASTGIAGGFSGNPPAQLATVLTLRTAAERGRASKGRMYLPPVDGYIGPMDLNTGQATLLNATRVATAGRALVVGLNAAYDSVGPYSEGTVGVASDIGSGTFRPVTAVSAGRVPDTMRSRRSKLLEAPFQIAI